RHAAQGLSRCVHVGTIIPQDDDRCVTGGYALRMATNKRERSDYSDRVAAQVRMERTNAGLTQAAVYEPAGMSRSTYIRIERGEHVLDVTQLAGICVPLRTSPADLLERVERAVIAESAAPQQRRARAGKVRTQAPSKPKVSVRQSG